MNTRAIFVGIIFSLSSLTAGTSWAGEDTPRQVAGFAKNTRAELKADYANIDKFLARMSDPAFAARVMEVGRAGDTQKLADFINKSVPMRRPITVDEIDNDWCIRIFTWGRHK